MEETMPNDSRPETPERRTVQVRIRPQYVRRAQEIADDRAVPIGAIFEQALDEAEGKRARPSRSRAAAC